MELLVSMAIIALLASILFGAMHVSRNKADQVQCMNNLRQLGMATMAYAGENNDELPFAWDRTNPNASENNFLAQLKPVIYSAVFDGYFDFETGVFACQKRLREPNADNNPFKVSYGMNASNNITQVGQRRTWEVESPSRTLLIADVNYRYNHVAISRDTPDQIGYKHNENANILYFDGHVESRSESNPSELIIGF